jgi:hypothetical protein
MPSSVCRPSHVALDQTYVADLTETESRVRRFDCMDLFYTHVLTGTSYARDREGQRFGNLGEACQSARDSARVLVSEEIRAGRDPVELEFHVCDEAGTRLATFAVSATVSGLD